MKRYDYKDMAMDDLKKRISELESDKARLNIFVKEQDATIESKCDEIVELKVERDKYKEKYLGLVTTMLMEYKAEEGV